MIDTTAAATRQISRFGRLGLTIGPFLGMGLRKVIGP